MNEIDDSVFCLLGHTPEYYQPYAGICFNCRQINPRYDYEE